MVDFRRIDGLCSKPVESFRDQLRSLVALFGSNRRAAEFLGVSHSQLPAWLAKAVPSDRTLQRIVDGAAAVKALQNKGLDDDQILTELNSTWPELGSRRPAELARSGAASDVVTAVALRYAAAEPAAPPATARELAETLQALAVAAAASAAALARGAA